MNLCIPFNTIEPLSGKLSTDSWSAYSRKQLDPRQKLNLETGLARAAVHLVIHLAATKISTGELAGLEVGDIIMTETGANSAAQILVEGTPMFEAFPGVLKGHKAVRVGQQLMKPRELIERQLGITPPVTPPKK